MPLKKLSFEDKIDVIDTEISKRYYKWTLKAVPSIDFDDVAQILRIHIYKKWNQWDQLRPLEPWLNRLITHQISNLIRNLYGNFARPCLSCPANQGGSPPHGLCAIYGAQCSACPLYAKWEKKKKIAHDIKLPLPLESHAQEVGNMFEDTIDIQEQANRLHLKMKEILSPIQYRVYRYMYIEGKSDDEIVKLMGYKTTEKNRKPAYKTLPNMRKIIIQKAKKIIERDL